MPVCVDILMLLNQDKFMAENSADMSMSGGGVAGSEASRESILKAKKIVKNGEASSEPQKDGIPYLSDVDPLTGLKDLASSASRDDLSGNKSDLDESPFSPESDTTDDDDFASVAKFIHESANKSDKKDVAKPVTHMGEGDIDEPRTSTKDALDYFVNVSNAVTEWDGMQDADKARVEAKWDEFIGSRLDDISLYAKDYPELKKNLDRLIKKGLDADKGSSAASAADTVGAPLPSSEGNPFASSPESPFVEPVTSSPEPVDAPLAQNNSEDQALPSVEKRSEPVDAGGSTPAAEGGTTPAATVESGTTPFPAEQKPTVDPNYKVSAPNFGKLDEYQGPGTFNNSIMSEKDKHELAKAQVGEKSRWQKFKDSFKPHKKAVSEAASPQSSPAESAPAAPEEPMETPFPEVSPAAPVENTDTATPVITPVESPAATAAEVSTAAGESAAAPESTVGAVKETEAEKALNEAISEIKTLWDKIPEDRRNEGPVLGDILEKGSVEDYFRSRREFYSGQHGTSDRVDEQLLEEARAVKTGEMAVLGWENAEKILRDAKTPGESNPNVNAAPSEQKTEEKPEIIQIQEIIQKNPHYGEENLTFIGKDGKRVELNAKQLQGLNPEGNMLVVKWNDVGTDTFPTPYDPANLRQVVDAKGNVLFDRASMNGAGEAPE